MKITTLMENTACSPEFFCEHGLSLYMETGNSKILFDAGQSGAFGENAAKLGIDLGQVDAFVLSHGHYDHGGGLPRFLEENKKAKIYVNQFAFEPHFNGREKYIGLQKELEENPRIIAVKEEISIAPGLTLHTLPLPPVDSAGLTVLRNDTFQPEDFRHEQYLLVEEEGKRILFSGCSHKGILQIVDHFRPDILVGGFHFLKIQEESWLKQAAETLLRYPTTYYTGHCTGEAQFAVMKKIMGERIHYLYAGTQVTV